MVSTVPASPQELTPPVPAGRRSRHPYVPWLVVWATCTWAMWAWPGVEVIPYHLAWAAFALMYGFEPWPRRQTLVVLGATTLATGALMVAHVRDGLLALDELAEVPLMLVLCLLVAWHVQRRDEATARAAVLARREVGAAARRERLARLTSHEMRTPLTIATGYVDLLLEADDPGADGRADLLVVRDELGRLARTSDRLVRMIRLQDILPAGPVDVDGLLQATARRFAAVAARRWVVEADAGTVQASTERLRACLDTLIENALRYTGPDDTVRLLATREGEHFWMGVADSGPGLAPDIAAAVNAGRTPAGPADGRSQTGLGLSLVRDIVHARHGRLYAGRSREGGALMVARLPVTSPAGFDPAAPPDSLPARRERH